MLVISGPYQNEIDVLLSRKYTSSLLQVQIFFNFIFTNFISILNLRLQGNMELMPLPGGTTWCISVSGDLLLSNTYIHVVLDERSLTVVIVIASTI